MHSLTLVILTFEDGENCLKTIRSALKLPYAEFVIVDCNVIPNWSLKDRIEKIVPNSQCKYLAFGESTIPEAMNHGLFESTGRWIWFLNSGDTIGKIDSRAFGLNLNMEADILVGKSQISYDLLDVKEWKYPDEKSWKFSFGINTFCHQACIFKKSSLVLWGGFPCIEHFDWVTTFYFTNQLVSRKISSVLIDYTAGGRSSKESLISWGLNNFKIRQSFRELFGGNTIGDGIVYAVYIFARILANLIEPRKRRNWWQVGN
jgi:hypothetical protein